MDSQHGLHNYDHKLAARVMQNIFVAFVAIVRPVLVVRAVRKYAQEKTLSYCVM